MLSSRPSCSPRGCRRRHRRVVAVRLLDGRHARAARLRRAAAHHAGRLRDLRRRARWRAASPRSAGSRCSGGRSARAGRRRSPWPRRSRWPRRRARRAARGSSRRCAGRCPESWRRVLPLPLAAGLYGVLLGLGFTTFILSFAVWALAGVSVALGDPALGLLVGLGFGIGRTLPVVVLAPLAGTERGAAAHAAMAERPSILRALRAADAAALAACAAALWAAPGAGRVRVRRARHRPERRRPAWSPSRSRAAAACSRGREPASPPPARTPRSAAASSRGSARAPSRSARRPTRPTSFTLPAAADAVAVSGGWVAWRGQDQGRDALFATAAPARRARAAGRRARRGGHHARPPRADRRPAAVPRRRRRARPDRPGRSSRPGAAARCARRRARCCSTPPATAAGCSTCAPPSSASSCGSASLRGPAGAARPLALRHRPDGPPRRGPRARRPQHDAHGWPRKLPPRPKPGVAGHALEHRARAPARPT